MRRLISALRFLAGLGLVAALVSCWSPYYSPTVSAAASFASKLGSPFLSIGPVADSVGMGDSQAEYDFMPSRPYSDPLNPVDGFLVEREGSTLTIGFVENYGGSYRLAPSTMNLATSSGSSAVIRSEASTAADEPQLIVAPDMSDMWQYSFDRDSHALNSGTDEQPSGSYESLGLGGLLLLPSSGDTDTYAVLAWSGSQYLVGDVSLSYGSLSGALSSAVWSSLDSGGASLPSGGHAFFDTKNGRFYYSESGGPTLLWNTADWASTAPAELAIAKLLKTSLTDGTLVAQDDQYMSAYSSSGSALFTVAAGGVHIQHELYCAAGDYVIFSQVLPVKASGGWKFYFYAWRYPLSGFRNLGN